jgi:hypothetical protein
MKKLLMAVLSVVATLGAGAAHADKVYWSVGVNAPSVGTVISNAPHLHLPAPPAIYLPPPPRVVYEEPERYYRAPPPRVVYQPPVVYAERGYRHHHHHHHDHHRSDWDDRGGRRGYRY